MLFVIIGALLIILGPVIYAAFKRKRASLRQNGVRAQAVVTEMRHEFYGGAFSMNGSSQLSYFPVLEYTADGMKRAKRYGTGTVSPQFQVGQVLNIVYDPKNPDNMELESSLTGGSGMTAALILMVMFIVLGVGVMALGALTGILSR